MATTGRKTKYSEDRVARIVKAFEEGNTRKTAAAFGGISFETFCQWMNNRPEFFDRVTRAESEAERRNVLVLQRAAAGYESTTVKRTTDKVGNVVEEITTTTREFDWRAAESWLKRRRREEWGDNVSIDIDREIADLMAQLATGSEAEATPTVKG